MEIVFRPCSHDPMEVIMGQAIWFTPINDVDGISATANIEGFTPLISITNAYDWDRELINQASQKCNFKGEIAILKQVKPILFLVPKTKGNSDTEFLIEDLISAISEMKIENLHFTHYGFVQKSLPIRELDIILHKLQNLHPQEFLKNIVIDVDKRFYEEKLFRS